MGSLPIRHLASPITEGLLLVKDLAQLAAVPSRKISIDADIEELTVIGIGIARMGHSNALVHLGASKLEDILRLAASDADLIGPGADASLGIEDQTLRAGDHVELSVHAEVELVANSRLLMAKVTVLPGAVQRGLRGFW